MRSATISVALLLCLAFVAEDLEGQETMQSLGELARRERERKQALSQAASQIQDLKFSPEEKVAYLNVESTVSAEQHCKEGRGKYVSWEQLFEGCGPRGTAASIKKEDDPRRDPNYDYRLTTGEDTLELFAVPQRAGLGGLFSDGKKIYFNPQGAASRESRVIWDFSSSSSAQPGAGPASSASPQPAQPAMRSKKVYTEEDLQAVRGTVSVVGRGTTAEAAPGSVGASAASAPANSGKDIRFSTAEACGTEGVNNIIGFESFFCLMEGGKVCLLEELEKKVAEGNRSRGTPLPPGWSLRQDDNYQYELTVHGDRFDVAATPKRSGLGGFYCRNSGPGGYLRGEQCFYNPRGAASPGDTPVSESSMSGLGCIAGAPPK